MPNVNPKADLILYFIQVSKSKINLQFWFESISKSYEIANKVIIHHLKKAYYCSTY